MARVPDSLTNIFKTRSGREVRDGGGITPDIVIPQETGGTITYYLMTENIVFDFVTAWMQKEKEVAPPESFRLTDADYDDFRKFVKSKNFKYDQLSERSLEQLRSIMEFEGYMNAASAEYKALEAKLQPNLDRDLELFKEQIRKLIESEIVQRHYYKKGVLIHQLSDDKVFEKALELLSDLRTYQSLLQPKKGDNPATAAM